MESKQLGRGLCSQNGVEIEQSPDVVGLHDYGQTSTYMIVYDHARIQE